MWLSVQPRDARVLDAHWWNSLLRLAREASAARVFLEVRESNQAARGLYSKLGFRETGSRPAYYSHPVEDAITYEIVIGL